jgi:hypothetical protein
MVCAFHQILVGDQIKNELGEGVHVAGTEERKRVHTELWGSVKERENYMEE